MWEGLEKSLDRKATYLFAGVISFSPFDWLDPSLFFVLYIANVCLLTLFCHNTYAPNTNKIFLAFVLNLQYVRVETVSGV